MAGVVILLAPGRVAAIHPGDEQIRRQLQEVLSRPEFRPPSWSLATWLAQQLAQFARWLGSLQGESPMLFWVLLIGCVVLLVLLVVHIALSVRPAFGWGGRRSDDQGAQEKRSRLSQGFFEEARRRAAQGDFTEAIRCLFLSLVYRFDESGLVLFPRPLTNREYLSLFGDRPEVRDHLRVFVDALDDLWYGQRPTDRYQYEHCLALYESLK
jgi:hypothetical protein